MWSTERRLRYSSTAAALLTLRQLVPARELAAAAPRSWIDEAGNA